MECKINDIVINYQAIGEGKPIIMLHGYSPDHRLMTGCMEKIFSKNSGYKRIYFDLPGMGKSSSAEWIVNSDIMLDIVIQFIEEIIPDENFLIVGESYGGYLLRGIVYKMAERVDGVAMICPLIIAAPEKRNVPPQVVLVKDDVLLSKLDSENAEKFNHNMVVQSEKIYERFQNEIIAGINIADVTFLERFQKIGYEFSFDVDRTIIKFDKPSLIVLGRQDSSVGYIDAWNILENYPRATFVVLDRAGHNLQIEQEDLFNSLMSEWLIRVEEF